MNRTDCCILEKIITGSQWERTWKVIWGRSSTTLPPSGRPVGWPQWWRQPGSVPGGWGQAAALCPSSTAVSASPSPCSRRTSYTPAHAALPQDLKQQWEVSTGITSETPDSPLEPVASSRSQVPWAMLPFTNLASYTVSPGTLSFWPKDEKSH